DPGARERSGARARRSRPRPRRRRRSFAGARRGAHHRHACRSVSSPPGGDPGGACPPARRPRGVARPARGGAASLRRDGCDGACGARGALASGARHVSFLETVERARTFLERHRRVSLRALRREFALDAETLAELSEELVQVQRVAGLEGDVLVWAGAEARTAPPTGIPPPQRDPRSYTPKHLADKILQSKSALEGERKQVTVLFADVKGSMELTESVDPEEWHGILDRFFAILTDGVHRFEGTINQYTGDGIMALFGVPIAHEDHAQRACYAALHLKDELRRYSDELRLTRGLNFSVRIGLNSGEVVVGKIGDDL